MYFYSDSCTAQTKTAPKQTKAAQQADVGGVSSEVSRVGDTVTLANERDDNVIFADTSTSEGESNDLITTSSAVDSGETSGYNISRPLHLDTAEGISKRLVSEGLTVEKADRAAYVLESMLMGEAPTQAELDVIMSSKQAFDMFREYFGTDVDLTASDALEHVTQRVAERNGGRNPIVNRLYTNENLLTNGRLDFNKILIEFMDSDIAPSKYRDAMNVYYEAGINGNSFESVHTAVALTDQMKYAAFEAGITAEDESVQNPNATYKEKERHNLLEYVDIELTKVDWSIINSERWHQIFEKVSVNKKINSALKRISEQIIKHRDGTFYEDMYFINAETGAIEGFNTSSKIKQKVELNLRMKIALEKEGISLIGIHNHPYSSIPSLSDLNAIALRNNQIMGVIICHNGTVFIYTKPKREISRQDYDTAMLRYKKYSKITREGKAFEDLGKIYGFEFRRYDL